MNDLSNANWGLPTKDYTWEHVKIALLMDLRNELKTLNRLIGCHNTMAIPGLLRDIKRNTTRRKYKKKIVVP